MSDDAGPYGITSEDTMVYIEHASHIQTKTLKNSTKHFQFK